MGATFQFKIFSLFTCFGVTLCRQCLRFMYHYSIPRKASLFCLRVLADNAYAALSFQSNACIGVSLRM
jgi:hypothetical protein